MRYDWRNFNAGDTIFNAKWRCHEAAKDAGWLSKEAP